MTQLANAYIRAIIAYDLEDNFTDERAAGSVNGTAATPGPGTRVVVDEEVRMPITGGKLVIAGFPPASYALGDPGLWLDAVTRVAGKVLVISFTPIW